MHTPSSSYPRPTKRQITSQCLSPFGRIFSDRSTDLLGQCVFGDMRIRNGNENVRSGLLLREKEFCMIEISDLISVQLNALSILY